MGETKCILSFYLVSYSGKERLTIFESGRWLNTYLYCAYGITTSIRTAHSRFWWQREWEDSFAFFLLWDHAGTPNGR